MQKVTVIVEKFLDSKALWNWSCRRSPAPVTLPGSSLRGCSVERGWGGVTQQALYLRAMVVLTVLTACGATLLSLQWSGGVGWTDVVVLALLAFVGQQTNVRRLGPGIDLSINS